MLVGCSANHAVNSNSDSLNIEATKTETSSSELNTTIPDTVKGLIDPTGKVTEMNFVVIGPWDGKECNWTPGRNGITYEITGCVVEE